MKTKILILSMLLLTNMATGFAAGGKCGDNLTWTLSSNEKTLTISGTGAMANYSYDPPWYLYRSSITTVVIGNGVTSIGDRAFVSCHKLASITIPNSVTSIGNSAFSGCSVLTSITIPNSVTSIGNSAFSSCSVLTSINVEDGNANYFSEAGDLFNRNKTTLICCPGGKTGNYTISNSVTSIGNHAFHGCSSLASITIPNSVTSIGNSAFSYCSVLTSITIPNSVTSIGNRAFYYCSGLTSITIPESVTSIRDSTFYHCSVLASITIPNSVTSIGNSAFYYCSVLASITIPNSVTSIGNSAFYYCSVLASITIPNSVTSIGYNAFHGCVNVTTVTIGNSVTSIGGWAFYGCSSLTSITIPNSVTSIGNSAFSGCSVLTSITIPNSVTSIGGGAFYDTDWLKKQPDGCVYAGKVLYMYKGNMPPNTTINLEEGTLSITDYALEGQRNLTSITIPKGITLKNNAFSGCTGLTTLTLPLKAVNGSHLGAIFSNSTPSSLRTVNVTDSATVKDNFFSNTNLTTINMPYSVTGNAFSGCTKLDTLIVGQLSGNSFLFDGTYLAITGKAGQALPAGILSQCKYLKELTLPFIGISPDATGESAVLGALFGTSTATNAITQYYEEGKSKKYGIPSTLQKLTVSRPATQIRYGALYNCSMLQELTIAGTVTGIAEKALHGCSGIAHLYVQSAMPPTAYDGIAEDVYSGCVLHIPSGSKEYYQKRTGWKDFFFFDEEAEIVINTQAVPLYGGVVNPSSQSCERNESVSFEALPNMGYTFKGWMEDNTMLGASSGYTFTATAPRTLYAIFTPRENADENIQIQSSSQSATLTWTAVEDAANYLLIIFSDEARTDTIASFPLDVNGNIVRSTTQNLSCTVPGLSEETQYYYSLTSYNSDKEALTISVGDFSTSATNGIEEFPAHADVRIYPNPVSESFRISGLTTPTQVVITDVSGKTVLRQTVKGGENIAIGHLPQGVYLAKIISGNQSVTKKIIKQ